MVNPVNGTNFHQSDSNNAPNDIMNNIVNAFESGVVSCIASDPSTLAQLSPSQVLGMTDVLQQIGKQIGGSFERDVDTISAALTSIVKPYNDLPDDDLSAWVGGQTSFKDYNGGKPVASFTQAAHTVVTVGSSLSSDIKGVNFTEPQVLTMVQGTLSSVIDKLNTEGFGQSQSYAMRIAGSMELFSDMGSSFEGPLANIITAVQQDASSWGETYNTQSGGVNQGVANYNQLTTDLQTLCKDYGNSPQSKDYPLPTFVPQPPPSTS
ncbi:MAG: hypothetical protein P0S95_05560 [Rhabdochlamydiaceae bacterium]|nr:hypothetical protein [Candidatus Amphrikana amoebophyrae]